MGHCWKSEDKLVNDVFWFLCLMVYQHCGLCNDKGAIVKDQYWYYLTHRWGNGGDKEVHTYSKSSSLKVNVTGVQTHGLQFHGPHFNHYSTGIPPMFFYGLLRMDIPV